MESFERQKSTHETLNERSAEMFEKTIEGLGENSEAVQAYQRLIATEVIEEIPGTGGGTEKVKPIALVMDDERKTALKRAIEGHPDVVLYKELELARAEIKNGWEFRQPTFTTHIRYL